MYVTEEPPDFSASCSTSHKSDVSLRAACRHGLLHARRRPSFAARTYTKKGSGWPINSGTTARTIGWHMNISVLGTSTSSVTRQLNVYAVKSPGATASFVWRAKTNSLAH